jgi:tRNA threonylcarbamoyladenosine biosynthesis protein TsaB
LRSDAPLILGFDTTAAQCAAVLLGGDRNLGAAREEMSRGQAERLMVMLEEVRSGAGAGWGDLDALAVCTGPGNFTGVRISVAAARGLALGLKITAIGIYPF